MTAVVNHKSFKKSLQSHLPESYETETDERGIYKKIHFKHNARGQLVKVSTPFCRSTITRRVALSVKFRRDNIAKFGQAEDGNNGVTLIGDEVFLEPVESYDSDAQNKKSEQKDPDEKPEQESALPTLEELLRTSDDTEKVAAYKPKAWTAKSTEGLKSPEKPGAQRYVPRFKRDSMVDNSKLFVGS